MGRSGLSVLDHGPELVDGAVPLHLALYAHRYFGDRDGDGAPDGGIKFPGAPPTTYQRLHLCQRYASAPRARSSDFNITTSKFRNLVTSHALITFVFNTMVLSLGINIIGNLMGQ